MNTQQDRAKALINDMLIRSAEALEDRMRNMIKNQEAFYKQSKERTIGKMLGQVEDEYSLLSCFRYQETIGATLREMERTFFEYFGKPWDFVEPPIVSPDMVVVPKKRGRPKKQ